MITLKELCTTLDELYTPNAFVDMSPNGLQVEGTKDIKKIAFAVTATTETIKQAAALGCNALIVHHGLFWSRDPYQIVGSKREKLRILLENDISLIAYHLPMDAHAVIGNNWKAALDLGLTDLAPFGIFEKAAVGVRGKIKPESRDMFKKRLEEYYKHPAHVAFGGDETIETVAIVSGGAYKLLPEAALSSIQAFVTGSFDLPAWHQAYEEKINFYALGHHATERIGPQALMAKLEKERGLSCCFIEEENPF